MVVSGAPQETVGTATVFLLSGKGPLRKQKHEKSSYECAALPAVMNHLFFFFSNVSEHRAISELVKQILFVCNRIRDTTDWEAWLCFCGPICALQK